MKEKILEVIEEHAEDILQTYSDLHDMPEIGFEEVKTSQYLKGKLKQTDIDIKDCTKTGILAEIEGSKEGPFVGLRGDIDALPYQDKEGRTYYVHACGHDSHATMVLWTTLILKKLNLVQKGKFRAIFQPGEEKLVGAKRMIEAGAIKDLDELYGAHIRPIQEARFGQASPALWHGASTMMEVTICGRSAHGARPHLGSNAIDGAALAILGINSIWGNPAEQWSVKATKISGGGSANNIIPEKATFTLDIRAAKNDTMEELIDKVKAACNSGARAVGGRCEIKVLGSVPAAEYDKEAIDNLSNAIEDVLGEKGLLDSIESPGSEDFHEYKKANPDLKVAYLALGSDCKPGLHDPEMTFNTKAIINGVKILTLAMYNKLYK